MDDIKNYTDEQLLEIFDLNVEGELKSRGYEYGWHKCVQYAGVIYVLVNPAFKNLVKIGYADDVEQRVKTLNSNSGLPNPYHVYATYKVKKRLEDLRLHGLIDSLNEDLRHAKNREFYEMSPKKAYEILSAIAQINGDEDLLTKNPMNDPYFEDEDVVVPPQQPHIPQPPTDRSTRKTKDVPDGIWVFDRVKKSDGNKRVRAEAVVKNGGWTLKKGSVLGIHEDKGVPLPAKTTRMSLKMATDGTLLEDAFIGNVTPSNAGAIVYNQSINGWAEWKMKDGTELDKFRKENDD